MIPPSQKRVRIIHDRPQTALPQCSPLSIAPNTPPKVRQRHTIPPHTFHDRLLIRLVVVSDRHTTQRHVTARSPRHPNGDRCLRMAVRVPPYLHRKSNQCISKKIMAAMTTEPHEQHSPIQDSNNLVHTHTHNKGGHRIQTDPRHRESSPMPTKADGLFQISYER